AGAGDRVALVGRLVLLVVVLLGRVRLALDHRLDALDDRGRLVLVLRERRAQRLLHAVAQVGERLGRVVALLAAHLALRLELPQRLLVVGRRRGGGALLERALDRVELGLRLGQLRRALGQRPERLELRHQGGALLLQQRLALLERLDRRRLLRTAVRREGEPARLGLRDRVELAADRRENDLRLVGPHVGVHRRLVGRLRGQRGGRGGDDVLGDEVAGAARDQARDRHARDGAAPHGRDGVPALGGGPRRLRLLHPLRGDRDRARGGQRRDGGKRRAHRGRGRRAVGRRVRRAFLLRDPTERCGKLGGGLVVGRRRDRGRFGRLGVRRRRGQPHDLVRRSLLGRPGRRLLLL